jgi:5-methylcytosine-specific restriction protein A
MSNLEELRPVSSPRLIDLVKQAGCDVTDWANCKGGESFASRNPKYCYEWCFIEPETVVVLKLWYDGIEDGKEGLFLRDNSREFAAIRPFPENDRALRMDAAIQKAFDEEIPIRAIIIEGRRRDPAKPGEKASRVSKQLLDPLPWRVKKYNRRNGDYTLTRGQSPFVDQFSFEKKEGPTSPPEKHEISGQAFKRSVLVRQGVLLRSRGKCEWCGALGFETVDGKIYLETHHIIALRDGGHDNAKNVAALCANDHRQFHYGKDKTKWRDGLVKLVEEKEARKNVAKEPLTKISK